MKIFNICIRNSDHELETYVVEAEVAVAALKIAKKLWVAKYGHDPVTFTWNEQTPEPPKFKPQVKPADIKVVPVEVFKSEEHNQPESSGIFVEVDGKKIELALLPL